MFILKCEFNTNSGIRRKINYSFPLEYSLFAFLRRGLLFELRQWQEYMAIPSGNIKVFLLEISRICVCRW